MLLWRLLLFSFLLLLYNWLLRRLLLWFLLLLLCGSRWSIEIEISIVSSRNNFYKLFLGLAGLVLQSLFCLSSLLILCLAWLCNWFLSLGILLDLSVLLIRFFKCILLFFLLLLFFHNFKFIILLFLIFLSLSILNFRCWILKF